MVTDTNNHKHTTCSTLRLVRKYIQSPYSWGQEVARWAPGRTHIDLGMFWRERMQITVSKLSYDCIPVCRVSCASFVECVLVKGTFRWLLYLYCPAIHKGHLRDVFFTHADHSAVDWFRDPSSSNKQVNPFALWCIPWPTFWPEKSSTSALFVTQLG